MTLIDKAEALLNCPFCGGEATFSEGETGDGKPWHYVECSDCEAMGPGVSYADHNIAVKSALADAWNRRALPARGVGVDVEEVARAIYDAMRFERKDKTPEWVKGGNSNAQVEARSTTARILAALAPTDAPHVNETPKSEHDGADVLTNAAQAREART